MLHLSAVVYTLLVIECSEILCGGLFSFVSFKTHTYGLSKSAYLVTSRMQLDFELMWRSRARNHFSRGALEVVVRVL